MAEQDYNSIEITNDFMFGYVMSEPERCKRFLEQILDIEIDHVEYLERQKSIDNKIDARSVRLDIYMSDGKTIYNCEMQTSSNKNLSLRSRYYQGQIDMNLITKGEAYTKLNKSYVIFICTFDLFGKERYIYSFENICKEDPTLYLRDETYKVFINTRGKIGDVSEDFKELMDYFNNPAAAEKSSNRLVKEIDMAVKTARSNDEWRHDYMTWQMFGNECKEEGRAEGRVDAYIEMIKEGLLSIAEAAKKLNITEETLQSQIKARQ